MKSEEMPNNALVSIIVPVYHAKEYIEKTIRSVEAQTFRDWELILVDDCGGDGSLELIRKIKETSPCGGQIRIIQNEKNLGAAMSRNHGVEKALGRYIAFLDADDCWLPTKLEEQLLFMRQKGVGFSFTSYEFGDENAAATGRVVHVPHKLDFRHALSRTVIFTDPDAGHAVGRYGFVVDDFKNRRLCVRHGSGAYNLSKACEFSFIEQEIVGEKTLESSDPCCRMRQNCCLLSSDRLGVPRDHAENLVPQNHESHRSLEQGRSAAVGPCGNCHCHAGLRDVLVPRLLSGTGKPANQSGRFLFRTGPEAVPQRTCRRSSDLCDPGVCADALAPREQGGGAETGQQVHQSGVRACFDGCDYVLPAESDE